MGKEHKVQEQALDQALNSKQQEERFSQNLDVMQSYGSQSSISFW